MLPEERARKYIDKMLDESGWDVVNRDDYTTSHSAIAVREGLLKGNLEADYLLFLDGKAIGVLEAKAEHINLDDIVVQQAENYTTKLPIWCSCWFKKLPFVYISNGKELMFRDLRNNNAEYEKLSQVHTPRELAALASFTIYYVGFPKLPRKALRYRQ